MPDPGVALVQDRTGNIRPVPVADYQSALDTGDYFAVTESDVSKSQAIKEAESLGGQAKTAVESTARGALSVGLAVPRLAASAGSALAGGEFGTDIPTGGEALSMLTGIAESGGIDPTAVEKAHEMDVAQRLRAERNPLTATAGEILGQTAAMGGLGISSLTGAVGKGVTRALGGRLAARTIGAGVGTALEGAPLGLIQAQDQAYLENRQLTGEQSVAALGLGAALGFGLGAGTHLAGEGLSKVFGAVKGGLAKAGEGGEASLLRKAMGTSDDAVANTVESTLNEKLVAPEVTQHVRDGFGGKNLAAVRAETEGAAAREVRAQLDTMEGATRNLTPEWRELKAGNVAKTIAREPENVATQASIVQERLGTIRQNVDGMLADSEAYGERAGLKKLADSVSVAERKVATALESGEMEHAYVAMDTLKKDMAPVAKARGLVSKDRDAIFAVQDMYEGLRQDLTHEAWGGAGAMQQKTNAAFEEWLGTKHIFDKQFMTETGKEGWQKTFGADPRGIESFMKGLGQSKNDLVHEIIDQHIVATKGLAKALSEAGELTPAKAAELKAITSSAEKFQHTITRVQKQVSAVDQAQNFIATTTGSQGVFSGATIAGSVVGGAPGAALGMGLDAIMNPGKFLAQRMKFEQMAVKTSDRLGGALDRFFGPMSKAAETVSKAAAAAKPVAEPGALSSVLGAFGAGAKSAEAAFERRRQEILTASANMNEGVRTAMSEHYGEVAGRDTHGYAAAVMTASNALDFLRGKMPESGPNLKSLTPMTDKLQPSKVEIQEYAHVWNAINDPVSVIETMAAGQMPSPAAIEAIKVVYPAFYGKVQVETMTRIREMDVAGEKIPPRHRMVLDMLLGLNGAGEPTFAPAFGAKYGSRIGGSPQEEQPRPRSGGAPMGIAKSQTTQTTSMLGGM